MQKAAGLGHNSNREYANLSTAEETGHAPYVQYPFVRKFVFLGWTDSTINSFGTCPPFQWHVAHNFPGGKGGDMRCYLSRDRFSGKRSFSFWGCVLIPDKGWRASGRIKKELNREGRSRL